MINSKEEFDFIEWELIQKSIEGSLTTQEEEQLNSWLSECTDHRDFYLSATRGGQSDPFKGLGAQELSKRKSELLAKISTIERQQSLTPPNQQPLTQPKKRIWERVDWKMAAAIAIPLIFSALLLIQSKFNREFSKDIHAQLKELANKQIVIAPGKGKAILMLEDGQSIMLSGDSTILKEDGTAITTHRGVLSYNSFRVADSVEQHNSFQTILQSAHGVIFKKSSDKEIVKNKVMVPRGGEFTIELSDGTRVWLNSESYIEYPVEFIGKTREVLIIGEAYLDVAKDPQKPFIVKTEDFNVRVLGTTFNINSYREMNSSNITVESGKVDVIRPSGQTTQITVNQQLTVDRLTNDQRVEEVDPSIVIAWKDGLFYFNRETLENISKELSRWYDIKIEIVSKELAQTRFFGKVVKYTNANQVLEMLALTGEIDYNISKEKITLYKK